MKMNQNLHIDWQGLLIFLAEQLFIVQAGRFS